MNQLFDIALSDFCEAIVPNQKDVAFARFDIVTAIESAAHAVRGCVPSNSRWTELRSSRPRERGKFLTTGLDFPVDGHGRTGTRPSDGTTLAHPRSS